MRGGPEYGYVASLLLYGLNGSLDRPSLRSGGRGEREIRVAKSHKVNDSILKMAARCPAYGAVSGFWLEAYLESPVVPANAGTKRALRRSTYRSRE